MVTLDGKKQTATECRKGNLLSRSQQAIVTSDTRRAPIKNMIVITKVTYRVVLTAPKAHFRKVRFQG